MVCPFPFYSTGVPPGTEGAHSFFEVGAVDSPNRSFARTREALPCPVCLALLLCPLQRHPGLDSDMEGIAITCCQETKKNAWSLLFQSQTGLDLFWHFWYFVVKTRPVLGIAGQNGIQYSWLTVSHTSTVTSVQPFWLLMSIDQLLFLLLLLLFHYFISLSLLV